MLAVPAAVAMSMSYVMPNAQAVEAAQVEIPVELQTFTAVGATEIGVTRDAYSSTAAPPPIVWPVSSSSKRSDGFGARGGSHRGTDFNPPSGSPIVSIAAGIVITSSGSGPYGTHVEIQHLVDGKVVVSLYAHMISGSTPLEVGDAVAAGQFVGSVGNTGRSTGTHLHLEIRPGGKTAVDPIAWLNARVT